MDIHCPTCDEPWDRLHLLEDEVHEWGLASSDVKDFQRTGVFTGPKDRTRIAAEAAGWKFQSNSMLSFTACPCCKRRPEVSDAEQRRQGVSILADYLDGDPDALASELAA